MRDVVGQPRSRGESNFICPIPTGIAHVGNRIPPCGRWLLKNVNWVVFPVVAGP